MADKQLIYYEHLYSKVHWKYTSYLKDNFDIIKLEDVYSEQSYCYGTDQYIKKFIESIKEKVIRYLPELNKVKIILGTIDKNNIFHRIIISVYNIMLRILKRKISQINIYKSIFVIIEYKDNVVFIGNISFDGLL